MRFSFFTRVAGVLAAALALSAQSQEQAAAAHNPAKPAEVLEGEGSAPRAAPTDYQAHENAGSVTIAAEFAGHSIPTPDGPLSTEEYIVVETGVFGPPGAKLALSYHDFTLRVNDNKKVLSSESYALVDVKDPEWAPPAAEKKSMISTGGNSNSDGTPPTPPKVPFDVQRKLVLRVKKLSFPEGERTLPRAGLLFFKYHGKEKAIHSLDLTYSGPAGSVTLELNP